MKIKKIVVFSFEDLSDSSKVRARAIFQSSHEYPHFLEAKASLEAFVHHFGARIMDYSLSDEVYRSYVKTTIEPSYFRGMKLRDFKRDHMPTGLWLDCSLWASFYDEFKKTGHAHQAFNQALESFLCELGSDIESSYSDESIEEFIVINEYEFNEDGSWFTGKEIAA